jgi:hypothetical protein
VTASTPAAPAPTPRDGQGDRLPAVELPRTWRPRRARIVTVIVAAALLVVCVIGWIAFPPSIRAEFTPLQAANLVVVLGFIDASLVAYSQCRVTVRAEGLVLRNVWRLRRIPWVDIRGLRYRKDDPWPMLLLAGEKKVGIMGIQTADGPRCRPAAEQLAAAMRPHLPPPDPREG